MFATKNIKAGIEIFCEAPLVASDKQRISIEAKVAALELRMTDCFYSLHD